MYRVTAQRGALRDHWPLSTSATLGGPRNDDENGSRSGLACDGVRRRGHGGNDPRERRKSRGPRLDHPALGFQAQLDKDNVGDPLIRSSSSGVNFNIYFYGCKKNKQCQSLQFLAGYDLGEGTTLPALNEWNKGKRFASAYLDDEDDPFLQMDLNTEGGMTPENFEKTFGLWQSLKGEFENHIGFHD